MNWLLLLVVTAMGAALVVQQFLHHKQTMSLVRMISFKEQIPLTVISGPDRAEPAPQPRPDTRKRVSIPMPGAELWRKHK